MTQRLSERQSKLVEILTAESRPLAIPEVATQLGCSERTVHRDVEALRQMAVEISTVPGRSGGLLLKHSSSVPSKPERSSAIPRSAEAEFVGRENENEQADRALEDVVGGQGRIVMVLGEPGIGKTRFARELAVRSQSRGFAAVWGRCRDIEGTPPYLPWTQAIRSLFEGSESAPEIVLPKENADVLAAAMPELARLISNDISDSVATDEYSQYLLYDSFARILNSAASDGPLLVLLEDLHWADQASLGLLEFLATEIDSSQIMIVGTARTIDPTVAVRLSATISNLARNPAFSRVSLGGLSRDEIHRIVYLESENEPTDALTDEIFAATEGNPFFTIEISRLRAAAISSDQNGETALEILPDAVKDVIARRLINLSDECLSVLSIGAVLGYRFDYDKILAVIEPELRDSALDLLDEALDAQVVRDVSEHGLAYEFGHALIHRYLYDSMPTGRRLQTHARIAEELERSYGTEAEAHAPELVVHFNEAQNLLGAEKVVKYSSIAGHQALAAYANAEAVVQFERAIVAKGTTEDVEAADLFFALADAHNGGGTPTETVTAMVRAFDIYEANNLIDKAVEVAYFGVVRAMGMGSVAQAEICERGLALVDSNSLAAAKILIEYGVALNSEGNFDKAVTALTRANEITRNQEDIFFEAKSLTNIAAVWMNSGQFRKAATASLDVIDLLPRIESPDFLVQLGYRGAIYSLAVLGEIEEAKSLSADLIKHDHTLPLYGHIDVDYQLICLIALAEGRWNEARRIEDRSHAEKPSIIEFAVDAHIGFMTGPWDSAIAEITDLVINENIVEPDDAGMHAAMLVMAGKVIGDPEALALAEKVANAKPDDPYHTVHPVMANVIRSVVATARGDSKAAANLYPAFLDYRQTWSPATRFMGPDRGLALLAETSGDEDRADMHFAEGIAFCKKVGLRPELAWCYHDYVRFLMAQSGGVDRSKAVEMLDAGLKITDELGMAPLEGLLSALRDNLLATSDVPVFPDGLTRREIEVLRLLAAGRSNREIAEELVITENTGAKHVANILAKTSSANRVEAANYASAHGLVDSPSANNSR